MAKRAQPTKRSDDRVAGSTDAGASLPSGPSFMQRYISETAKGTGRKMIDILPPRGKNASKNKTNGKG